MPLRDHFRPPVNDEVSWEGFHGQWPAMMVLRLVERLPGGYSAEPRARLGSFEIDVGGFDKGVRPGPASAEYEYAVEVYARTRKKVLVAAVELVSPGNKDRPEKRRAFADKCAAMLRRGVSVAVVDLVTERHFNLYRDVIDLVGQSPAAGPAPALYASTCRFLPGSGDDRRGRFEEWDYPLAVGGPLPTLPLWLAPDLSVPLELEASYEETCRVLGIP